MSPDPFSELRSILQRPPGPEVWHQLTALLDPHPDDEQLFELLIPYAVDHLRRWPDPVHASALPAWIDDLTRGRDNPRLQLATHLEPRLSVFSPHIDDTQTRIAASPHLLHIRSLNLEHAQLSAAGARTLAAQSSMPALRRFAFSGSRTEPDGVRALFGAPWLKQLTHLVMRYGDLTPELAQRLLRALDGAPLVRLTVNGAQAPASLPLDMRHTSLPATLEVLQLDNSGLRIDGALALAALPFQRLHTLTLMGARIGDDGLRALIPSPCLSQLTELHLGYNNLSDAGITQLVRHPAISSLRELSLYGNHIGDDGAIALAQSPHLRQLTGLHMDLNDISRRGAQALATSQHLQPHLRDHWRALYP